MGKSSRVVVGLSGGVDSSVSAKLLVEAGYEVIGIFMKNWEDKDDPLCPAAIDAADARAVADQLGIQFYSFNFAQEYWRDVFEDFLQAHRDGLTPNPDIWCNQYIKFKVFLEKAEELGADFLATGHYAKNYFNEKTGLQELQIPEDKAKDQTYFVYTLGQSQLQKVLFPLEDLDKSEVRRIAQEANFTNANKKDSTGICFVGERNYSKFLQEYLEKEPGDIIELETGRVLGQHIGLSFYTFGQRRELHIGGVKGAKESPWFVVNKNFDQNRLEVSQDENQLLTSELKAHKLTWVAGKAPDKTNLQARIRYRSEAVACEISSPDKGRCPAKRDGGVLRTTFASPVRAVTPGQSIVFYDGEICLGGGIII